MADVELMPMIPNRKIATPYGGGFDVGQADFTFRIRNGDGFTAPSMAEAKPTTRLLFYTQQTSVSHLEPYISYLSDLLAAAVVPTVLPREMPFEAIGRDAASSDLVIVDEPDGLWLERLLRGRADCSLATWLPVSTLLARQPCWPLRHILLVMRIDETDEAAAEWTIRLAGASGAAVTILPIVAPIPALDRLNGGHTVGLDGLLSPNTLSGAHLRRLLDWLASSHIDGTLRLREGEPQWQLRQEIGEGKSAYDLVIIGAEGQGSLYRWLMGELVGPLLRWINRPVLIAR